MNTVNSRGRRWSTALSGTDRNEGVLASVLVQQTDLGEEPATLLTVVPDLNNPFPRARGGQVGLLEGWTLAHEVRQIMQADASGHKRAIVALVDVPSQAYGRTEEQVGLQYAAAAATDAYVSARLAGHAVVTLVVGGAVSGGFLTHGLQSSRLLALDDAQVTIHAMKKAAAARVTRRSVSELERLATQILPMSYQIGDYEKLGLLHALIRGVNADDPTVPDVQKVREALRDAVRDARREPELSVRWTTPQARQTRAASLRVRDQMTAQWDE